MSSKAATEKASKSGAGFTAEEKAAMQARAQEMKAEARASKSREEGEQAVSAAIVGMNDSDRVIAERIHQIIKGIAPDLMPKTWYGMPAYGNQDGKVICFYQAASKFNTRYGTLGFSDVANLDEGAIWPTTFAVMELTAAVEATITALVKRAVS